VRCESGQAVWTRRGGSAGGGASAINGYYLLFYLDKPREK
jgi:hypothetical protein